MCMYINYKLTKIDPLLTDILLIFKIYITLHIRPQRISISLSPQDVQASAGSVSVFFHVCSVFGFARYFKIPRYSVFLKYWLKITNFWYPTSTWHIIIIIIIFV